MAKLGRRQSYYDSVFCEKEQKQQTTTNRQNCTITILQYLPEDKEQEKNKQHI